MVSMSQYDNPIHMISILLVDIPILGGLTLQERCHHNDNINDDNAKHDDRSNHYDINDKTRPSKK